ncbi:MAG: DUF2079 domain-containing protein, partial [Chloroflexi bacterium]|nr:DUF2079 domain-containing protein [Chloroflexota bacterium]
MVSPGQYVPEPEPWSAPISATRSLSIAAAHRSSRWPLLLAGAAVVLYVAVFFVLRMRLYDGLYIGLWDQGFIQQALYNTLHGRPLEISISHEGYTHLFAEHFFLFALALLPFYALAPHPATLFLLEAVATGGGGLALYLVARRRLGNDWLALALAVAYLLHPTLQWANLGLVWYGFHLENFFPPLFLLAVAAADAGRPRVAGALFVLSLSVAEVFAIPVALYGLARAARRPEDRRLGLTVLLAAVLSESPLPFSRSQYVEPRWLYYV